MEIGGKLKIDGKCEDEKGQMSFGTMSAFRK